MNDIEVKAMKVIQPGINTILMTEFETPLGAMVTCGTDDGICLLEFTNRRMLPTEMKSISKLMNAKIADGESTHFHLLKHELDLYFEGKLRKFSIPIVTPGSAFQQLVWQALLQIPYGSTRSYKQQAVALQKPEAIRAVAGANGMNRIAILIPCHRVIGEDGSMTGYGGGIWRKRWLLDMETGQATITH